MVSPSVGKWVLYVDSGSAIRPGIVTEVFNHWCVSLCVFMPRGLHWDTSVMFDESAMPKRSTWHWPKGETK